MAEWTSAIFAGASSALAGWSSFSAWRTLRVQQEASQNAERGSTARREAESHEHVRNLHHGRRLTDMAARVWRVENILMEHKNILMEHTQKLGELMCTQRVMIVMLIIIIVMLVKPTVMLDLGLGANARSEQLRSHSPHQWMCHASGVAKHFGITLPRCAPKAVQASMPSMSLLVVHGMLAVFGGLVCYFAGYYARAPARPPATAAAVAPAAAAPGIAATARALPSASAAAPATPPPAAHSPGSPSLEEPQGQNSGDRFRVACFTMLEGEDRDGAAALYTRAKIDHMVEAHAALSYISQTSSRANRGS